MGNPITKKPKKEKLMLHKGCQGCKKNCLYNRPVTTATKNATATNLKFGCNSSKDKK